MDIGVSCAKKKGKTKVDGTRGRRTWHKFEEDFAIGVMRELVLDPKWKLDTGAFRSGFFVEVEKKLVKTFYGIDLRASPHIESKVKVWKRHYHTLSDMLKTSGFGWDDEKKMILVDSDDVWNNYVAREPEAAHMRHKSWPYYDDWLVLFGRDRATGDLAEDAVEMVETMTLEQASVNLDDDLDGGFNNPTSMDVLNGSTGKSAPAVSMTATSKGGKKRTRVNDVASCAKKKDKVKIDGTRGQRTWQKFEEDFAIAAMRELILDPKWKLDTGAFRSGFFVEVEKKIVKIFPGIDLRASPHIESKVKVWKRHYHTLSNMLITSGFGWDDEKKMILVDSDDVWNNYVARGPEAAHMRHKSWPYYDDWLVLFGSDRAAGDLAEDAVEMVETMTFEQASVNFADDLDGGFNNPTSMDVPDGSTDKSAIAVSTTFMSKGGKKRDKVNDVATKCLIDLVATFSKAFKDTNSSLAKIADSLCYQNYKDTKMEDLQKNLNDELTQLSLNLKQRMKALRLLSKDDTLVRLFYNITDNSERTELIEGLLEKA